MQAEICIEPDWFGNKNCLLWYWGKGRVSHTFSNEVGRGRRWKKTLRLELKVYFNTVHCTIFDQYVILRNKGRFISVLPCQTYTCTDCNVLRSDFSDLIFFRHRVLHRPSSDKKGTVTASRLVSLAAAVEILRLIENTLCRGLPRWMSGISAMKFEWCSCRGTWK